MISALIFLALVTEVILVYILDFKEGKEVKMEGTTEKIEVNLDTYNQMVVKAKYLDDIEKLLKKRMNEEIQSNKKKAKASEYLMTALFIDSEDICNITRWDYYKNFKEEFCKADDERRTIINRKMHIKEEE